MLKIGDFSKVSRISIRMLRHYDAIGLLVPAEVDDFTGYRYYSEEQLPRAGRIQTLKCMGFGLTVIGDILKKHQNAEEMERFLLDRRAELEGQERIIQEQLYFLDNAVKRLRKEGNIMDYSVTLKTLPEREVASVRQIIPAYNQERMLWEILNREIAPQNVRQAVPCYGLAIFHDEGFKEGDVDVEIQVAVEGTYKDTEHVIFKKTKPFLMASATYKGSYEQITEANSAVANWINENGYEFDGASFCIYHVSPYEAASPEELVTEVCYPVKKK